MPPKKNTPISKPTTVTASPTNTKLSNIVNLHANLQNDECKKTNCCKENSTSSPNELARFFKPGSVVHIESDFINSSNKKQTRITVKYDVGFGNFLSIRGKGDQLNWISGIPLKNVDDNTWTWETDELFTEIEFKILINDQLFECGENHKLKNGAHLEYTPHF